MVTNLTKDEDKIISLSRDFMFGIVFNKEENIPILEHLLSAYLAVPLKDIKGNVKLLSRRQIPINYREAKKEVDVLLSLNGEKYNIEMNACGFGKYTKKRNLIFAAKVLAQEYKRGDNTLADAHNVLQINFNASTSSFNGEKPVHLISEFTFREKNKPDIEYSDILKIDVIDMAKALDSSYNYVDEREKAIAHWCRLLLSNSLSEIKDEGGMIMDEESLEKLMKEMKDLSSNEEVVKMDWEFTKQEIGHYDEIAEARAEVIEQGHAAGVAEGIEQGHAAGVAEGLAEGRLEERALLFETMRANGMSDDDIARVTGITVEEQKRLIK